jgi:transcriptional regulator with XRE-family HTH domain
MRDWLITIRKKQGLSQKEVSERIGVSQPSYCTIERGVTNPSVDTAKRIAEILGFDWTRFYETTQDAS